MNPPFWGMGQIFTLPSQYQRSCKYGTWHDYFSFDFFVSLRIFFGLAVFLSFVLVVYGFLDAQRIRVKKLEVQTENFLPNDGRIRIVQISDVHVGLIIRGARLQALLDDDITAARIEFTKRQARFCRIAFFQPQ